MQRWACCQRRRRWRELELGAFRLRARRRDSRVRRECRGFAGNQEIAECPPVETLTPTAYQLHKTGGGGLRIREGVVRFAVHDAQFPAKPLESDRVLQVEELGREPGGIDVVGVKARADGTSDQPGVKRIGTVLHKHGALCEPLKPFDHR